MQDRLSLTEIVKLDIPIRHWILKCEEDIQDLEKLLKEAHDKMDDDNNELDKHIQRPMCKWCGQTGYNSGGLDHTKDCILVKIRHVIKT